MTSRPHEKLFITYPVNTRLTRPKPLRQMNDMLRNRGFGTFFPYSLIESNYQYKLDSKLEIRLVSPFFLIPIHELISKDVIPFINSYDKL